MAQTQMNHQKSTETERLAQILSKLEIITIELKEVLQQPDSLIPEPEEEWTWLREFNQFDR